MIFCQFDRADGRCVCRYCHEPDQLGKSPCHKISRPCRKRRKGIGDYVADVASIFVKKKCEPCKQRQEKLNELGRRITG